VEEKATQQEGLHRILVVDDDDDILTLISRVLKEMGYDVITASRGFEALQSLKTEKIDMIILDAMLPEVHGFDICRKIKGSPKYKVIPVIMISAVYRGWRYAKDIKESYGVDDFIEKPFKIEELVRLVDKHARGVPNERDLSYHELSQDSKQTLIACTEAYRAGEIDKAIYLLEKSIEIDPLAYKLRYQLGLLLGKNGEYYRAIQELENALDLKPDDFQALKNLAVLYQKTAFTLKAIETWERALEHAPDDATRESIKTRLMSLL
jgi:DNA-binding response OmpR family regulator